MATAVHQGASQVNGVAKKSSTPRAPIKKPYTPAASQTNRGVPNGIARAPRKAAAPVQNKAASIAGERPGSGGVTSAYATLVSRLANRVADMAENMTFVERSRPQEEAAVPQTTEDKKRPRKLEMRLNNSAADSVAFSAPFLDNTLQKMLLLQNRMLKTTAEMSRAEGADEKVVKEQAAQAAELSRIIALICAEKARQGA